MKRERMDVVDSRVEKGKFAVIKKGSTDYKKEEMKGYIVQSIVNNEKHGNKSLRLATIELKPGAEVPEHNSACEEIYYVLEGKGTIGVDGVDYEVEAGDVVYRAENVWHGPHRNTGDKPLKLLFVVSFPMRPSDSSDVWFRGEDKPWEPKIVE